MNVNEKLRFADSLITSIVGALREHMTDYVRVLDRHTDRLDRIERILASREPAPGDADAIAVPEASAADRFAAAMLLRLQLEGRDWKFSLDAGRLHVIVGENLPGTPQDAIMRTLGGLAPELETMLAAEASGTLHH